MVTEQATDVRKEWSAVCDSVIHQKPKFIKRTRDYMVLLSLDSLKNILDGYIFTADKYVEDDGSITLSLHEIDLIENAEDEKTARQKMGNAILEYAVDYYNDYELYSKSTNRKSHIPYVFKALVIDSPDKIGEELVCQNGKN